MLQASLIIDISQSTQLSLDSLALWATSYTSYLVAHLEYEATLAMLVAYLCLHSCHAGGICFYVYPYPLTCW